jgi:hypothetical protein
VYGKIRKPEGIEVRDVPSRENVKRVEAALKRMKEAQEDYLAFIDQPSRSYSAEERAENNLLLYILKTSITEFSEAYNQAATEDVQGKVQPSPLSSLPGLQTG